MHELSLRRADVCDKIDYANSYNIRGEKKGELVRWIKVLFETTSFVLPIVSVRFC